MAHKSVPNSMPVTIIVPGQPDTDGLFVADSGVTLPILAGSKLYGVPPPNPPPADSLAPSVPLGVQVAIAGSNNTVTCEPCADAFANATGAHLYSVFKDGSLSAYNTQAGDNAINPNFTYTDIGSPMAAGSAVVDATGLGWTMNAAGSDFFGTSDNGGFLNAPWTGDGVLRLKLVSFAGAASFAKRGIMFRESTAAGSAFAHLCWNYGAGTVSFDTRASTGASAANQASNSFAALPVFLKLVRASNLFSAYYSADGNNWTLLISFTLALAASLLVGHTGSSAVNGTLKASVVTNFTARTDGTITFAADTGNAVPSTHTYAVSCADTVPNTSALSASVTAGSTVGVEVGASGKLVSTFDGTTLVYLTLIGVQGGEFGANWIQAIANVTSAQWAAGFQQWYSWLQGNQGTTIANTYGVFNTVRLYLNSAAWLGSSGVDPGGGPSGNASKYYRTLGTNSQGHVIYCAGATGGTVGTTDGTETDGDGTGYQNAVDTIINNVLGASSILGYTTYIILNLDWTTPVIASTGQRLLPTSQPCALSTADLTFWQQVANKYKGNLKVIFELQNEPYYSAEGTGGTSLMNYESSLLGNSAGTGTTFNWPNATSIGDGGSSSYLVNFGTPIAQGSVQCSLVSYQQVLAAIRTAGAHNLVLLGALVNSGGIFNWSQNGGSQSVTDTYTVGGIQQYAAILHSYGYPGAATFSNGKTGAGNILGLIAAGTPFVLDEFGTATTVGSTGANGYSWMKANGVSGHGMTCWANFDPTGTGITNIYNQGSFSITGINPWSNFNVPNPSSAGSQVPNGSN
jgi:hypothetical protein